MVRSVWHHPHPLGWLLALVAVTIVTSGLTLAQQNQVQPNQLQVFVSAVDASGAPVTDLKPEEIAMTENGAPGKVLSLDRHNLPIKLTIGIDNSKEIRNALAVLRTGLTGLVEALPPDVEVALMTTAPQPAMFVRSTTDRAQLTRGIERFGPDSTNSARFSDALIEYADRLEKDFKDKKLTYAPMLVMVSTSAPENANQQLDKDRIEKALKTLLARGARVSLLMTTTRPTDAESVDNLKNGRQVIIAAPLVNASRGKFQTLVAFSGLGTVLPEWGKEIGLSHTRQINQFRVVIERPGGATGPLNNLAMRVTRPGVNGSVSADGRQ
jgi:hypothetical protein